jgi:hypothetical protein
VLVVTWPDSSPPVAPDRPVADDDPQLSSSPRMRSLPQRGFFLDIRAMRSRTSLVNRAA